MTALVWTTFASEAEAAAVSGHMLDEGLVACANILPEVRSLYAWQGERDEARECAVLFKTDGAVLAQAVARLEAVHPYACPAIFGWHADAAGTAASEWVGALAASTAEPAR